MVEKITLILNENLAVKSSPFTTIPCTNPLQTAERSFFPRIWWLQAWVATAIMDDQGIILSPYMGSLSQVQKMLL